jgi:hypothetical protein
VEVLGHSFTHSLPAAMSSRRAANAIRRVRACSGPCQCGEGKARIPPARGRRGGRWRGTRSVLTLQSLHDSVFFCDILEAGRLHFSRRDDLGSRAVPEWVGRLGLDVDDKWILLVYGRWPIS